MKNLSSQRHGDNDNENENDDATVNNTRQPQTPCHAQCCYCCFISHWKNMGKFASHSIRVYAGYSNRVIVAKLTNTYDFVQVPTKHTLTQT